MNKIVNINLGGYPFTIDENAYAVLKEYLNSIRNHFRDSEGCDEIVADIESRLAEIFSEKLGTKPILTIDEVEAAIKTMGTPEEIGDDSGEEQSSSKSGPKVFIWGRKTGKRLFRNPDDKVLGGVCSGIAAYFGIEDPIWIRIIVALAFFMGGMGALPYIILWAILPAAKTSADKLAMRGEPINVSNIAKTVEDEINNLTKNLSQLGEELQSKYGKSKKKEPAEKEEVDPDKGSGGHKIASEAFEALGAMTTSAGYFLRNAGRTLVFVICGLLIAALALSWISLLVGFTFIYPYESYFVNSPISAFIALTSTLLIIGIPILFVVFLCLKLVFSAHLNNYWGLALWAIWFVGLAGLMITGASMAKEFNEESYLEERIRLNLPPGDTLNLSYDDIPQKGILTQMGNITLTDGKLLTKPVRLNISKSDSGDFELRKTRSSRGRNKEMATRFAYAANYNVVQDGEQLIIPSMFSIDKGHKWRAQTITLELKVPEGKSIHLDEKVHWAFGNVNTAQEVWHTKMSDNTWKMTKDGLVCQNCEESTEY